MQPSPSRPPCTTQTHPGSRAFRLDRIRSLRVLDETFTPHDMTSQAYFEACREKYLSSLAHP